LRIDNPSVGLEHILDYAKLAIMNLQELQSKAGDAEALLKAVANRNRLVILCELLKGERSVSALQGAIGLSQSALSQHLARLREDELVATRRKSQTIYYSLASQRVTRLIGLLYELYCAPGYGTDTPRKSSKRRTT
jgi:ArsR family transcriptional regulator, virulence genes transcriptional regulator